MPKKVLITSVLVILFSFLAFSAPTDSLQIAFLNSSSDTARASICYKISKCFEDQNPDSSLFWLKKGYSIVGSSSFSNPADSVLAYHKAVFQTSLAMKYCRLSNSLTLAQLHLDSAIVILKYLYENNRNNRLRRKSLHGQSVVYGVWGRIAYLQGDIQSAINHYTAALEIQEKLQAGHGLAMMYNNIGLLYSQQANYSQSLVYLQKSLDYFNEVNDSLRIATAMVNIGSVTMAMGIYDASLHSFFKALNYFTRNGNLNSMAVTHINIGDVYMHLSNRSEAMFHFKKANSVFKDIKDDNGLAKSYMSIGVCHAKQGNSDSSIFYLGKAERLFKETKSSIQQVDIYMNLGDVYLSLKRYLTSQEYFEKAFTLSRNLGLNQPFAKSKLSLARVLMEQYQYNQAYAEALLALEIAKKYSILSVQKECHETISLILEKLGNYSLALEHYKLFFNLNDSLMSKENARKGTDMEILYQLEQNQRIISQLEKEKALQLVELNKAENQIAWQRKHSILTSVTLVILLVVMFLLYKQFRAKRSSNQRLKDQYVEIQQKNEEIITQKEEIEAQRNELEIQREIMKDKTDQLEKFNWLLTDSIDYASSIQSALMPTANIFSYYFSDQFIMFFPKDVVSGDFYWAFPNDNSIVLALADCTGHGVPGGFMSMLGISALTELMGRHIFEPSDILNNLRLFVIESFKQSGKIGEHQDGMDIAILSYTKGSKYIDFAGANHPMWIIRKNEGSSGFEIIEQKGDRMPVSFHFNMTPFTTYRTPIQAGDQIYLFSDGFRDQLGGENFSQKFGKESFQALLLKNAHKSMDEQKNILEDAFFRWVGGGDQLDDITILGIKI